MNKLPTYLSQVVMYVLVGVGLYKFIQEYQTVETIIIEETNTSIGLVPLLIVSAVVFVLFLGVGMQLLILLWKWFSANKTAIIFPFLMIAIGVIQLFISVMTTMKTYIATNSLQYIENLNTYIDSSTNLAYWIAGGLLVGLLGLVYDYIIKLQA